MSKTVDSLPESDLDWSKVLAENNNARLEEECVDMAVAVRHMLDAGASPDFIVRAVSGEIARCEARRAAA